MSPSRTDAGITLIELVVGMLLAGIVLVVAVNFIIGVLHDGERAQGDAKATAAATLFTTRLSNELKAAESPDRSNFADWEELRSALLSPPTATVDIRDVLVAEPGRLVVRVDVARSAGVECLEYRDSGTKVHRIVTSGAADAWRGCSGAVLATSTVLERPAGTVSPPLFSYTTLESPAAGWQDESGSCSQPDGIAEPFDPLAPRINQIIAVSVSLDAFSVKARDTRKASARTTIGLCARNTHDYLQALGCAV